MSARWADTVRPGAWAYGLAALVMAADQLSKQLIAVIMLGLQEGRSVEVAPFLSLTFRFNSGISFGLLEGGQMDRWLLGGFAVAVCLALAVWVWTARRRLTVLSVGLLMGGVLGNLTDRLRWGEVADFIDISALHFPRLFNVADLAVTAGAALLLADLAFAETAKRRRVKGKIRA